MNDAQLLESLDIYDDFGGLRAFSPRKIVRLAKRAATLEKALRDAREAMRRHDEADFQCESVAGAEGARSCVETLDAAIEGQMIAESGEPS